MLTRRFADPAAPWRLLVTLMAVLLLWPGVNLSELDLSVLFSGKSATDMAVFIAGFWPLALQQDFLHLVLEACVQTLAMATAGILLAMILAIPGALLASRVLSVSALPRHGQPVWWSASIRLAVRAVLIVLRSVPEVVWALLLVRAVGLGPTAGVLAIAITYGGMLGKVYGEILESADPQPSRALLLAGSGRLAAFLHGVLPGAAAELVSYTVYRWECAIRASVVMGFVGAGGLGQQVELSMRMFAGGEVATLLLTFLLLVLLADLVSRLLRARLMRPRARRRDAVLPLLIVLSVLASFAHLDIRWLELVDARALAQMQEYAGRFFPVYVGAAHLEALWRGTLETLAMSVMGTLLAVLLGVMLALPAAGRWGYLPMAVSRLILNALRAIPELVWAALMVLAAGLGPNAGALALALHTTGVLGRLFAEALENTSPEPALALRDSGSPALTAFLYGSLPGLWPQWLAYSLYRWENNIRMASVLGFVGAGGLGQMLYVHLSLFQEAQAATVLAAMLVLVFGVDVLSSRARLRWVRG